jgi:hypothetical protein
MSVDAATLEWQRERWKGSHDPDPVVNTVIKRMQDRSAEGIRKYGCTMLRDDLTSVEWIDHAIEEALDFAVYLERLKLDLKRLQND